MKSSVIYLTLLLFFSPIFLFSQQGSCTQPSYCDRNCWDSSGNYPQDSSPTNTTPTHIIIHHAPLQTGTDYKKIVRSIWNYHVVTNGWDDIGYNWLIGGDGVIYEGRGDGVQGAHFSGTNSKTMGVCVLGGDFDTKSPTSIAQTKLRELIAWEATDKKINVLTSSTHNSGHNLYHISGHKDHPSSSTKCPGANLYSLIPTIRTDISKLSCYNNINTPNNDECNDAISLQSSENCNSTTGTVDGARSDNTWADATCDKFSRSSLAADVFYKFTAKKSSHTISVQPTGNLDPVVSLYQGSNCYSLNEIGCADSGGGDGKSETIAASGLTVGQTYWIRIYDFGGIQPTNGAFNICVTHTISEDITVTNANVFPTTINSGGSIEVSVTQSYTGSKLEANLPSFDIGYYLSTDCNLSSNDVLLGDDSSSLGSDDPSNNEKETVTIPTNTVAGTYYIIFSVDDDEELKESNENNNTACIQVIVNKALSIKEQSFKKQINIYPNPTNGILRVASEGNVVIDRIIVFDINGRQLKLKEGDDLNNINISEFNNGMYLVQIVNNKNESALFRILKQ